MDNNIIICNDLKLEIRENVPSDNLGIEKLLVSSFGTMPIIYGALSKTHDKYLIAIINDSIIAMTGLVSPENTILDGYEISYTCVDKEFRGLGVTTKLLTILLQDIKGKVYCSCWKPTSEGINMKDIMKYFGFQKIEDNYLKRNSIYCSSCITCPYYKSECVCVDDLYLRTF